MSSEPTEPSEPSTGATDAATKHYEAEIVARARAVLYEPPEAIGPYRIFERIGGGGMGDVYRAEQREGVRRPVAIKLIRPGFDTRQVVTRFEAERQALAMMHHPHIAQVYAAGNDETGRPYFVMEYVPGKPVTHFADENKLTVRQRLELFLQICSAITHAHTKLIIHRDIKSSNVLAYFDDEKQPVVKVIDFGVAKALSGKSLSDATLYTAHGEVLGTYDSMSPEQAAGSSDIDTRTDVYSLGVLLYELLAGAKPFDYARVAEHEIRRIIREVEPPPPSTRLSSLGEAGSQIAAARRSQLDTLTKELGGELEWIPLMAMRKERDRRYESPAALAADVERYIAEEPLEAGPESLGYRIRKFTAKHRLPIAVAMVLATALGLGFLGTTTQMVRAKHAESEASEQRDQLKAQTEKSIDILKGVVFPEDPKKKGETLTKSFFGPDDSDEAWTFILKREHDGRDDFRVYRGSAETEEFDFDKADYKSPKAPVNPSVALGALAYSVDRMMRDIATEKEKAQMEAYVADLSAAQSALASNNLAEARERLEACPQSRRGWEWGFLGRRAENIAGTLPVGYSVEEFTPDGKQMVVYARDGTVQWRDAVGNPIGEALEAGTDVYAKLITDGQQLATASTDGIIGLWDRSGRAVHPPIDTGERWKDITFSPDGTLISTIASADKGVKESTLSLWNLKGQRVAGPTKIHSELKARFSKDGKRLITVWLQRLDVQIFDLDLRPISKQIARVFDAEKQASATTSFGPDNARLLSLINQDATLTGVDGRAIATLGGKDEKWSGAEFSPDGRFVLTYSDETRSGTLWDKDGKKIGDPMRWGDKAASFDSANSEIKTGSDAFKFSGDGAKLIFLNRTNGKLAIRDLRAGSTTEVSCPGHNRFILSADNTRILTWSAEFARAWDMSGQPTSDLMRVGVGGYADPQFSPDDSLIVNAMAGPDGATEFGLWDASGKLIGCLREASLEYTPKFAPDGKHVLLEPSNKAPVLILANDSFTSPIENVSVGDSLSWEIESARSSSSPMRSQNESVNDGPSVKGGDGDAKVRNGMPENVFERLCAQYGKPTTSARDHTGGRLVTGGDDSTLRFWDTHSWREVATFRMDQAITSCEFTADDSRLIILFEDGGGEIWDTRDAAARRQERNRLIVERTAAQGWATHYIDDLFATQSKNHQWMSADELKNSISADGNLEWPKRVAAVDELQRRVSALFDEKVEARKSIYKPDAPEAEVQATLLKVERIAGLVPENENLKQLGGAQYRAGLYKEALQTLDLAADPLSQWAPLFKAMSNYKLGDKEAAKRYLAEAKALREQWGLTFESHAVLFDEAEAMIEPVTKASSAAKDLKQDSKKRKGP